MSPPRTSGALAWRSAFLFAARELRGGVKGLRIFLACIVLGVAAIAGIGMVRDGLLAGLAHEGRALLGGDLDFALVQRVASSKAQGFLAARAGRLSQTAELRAMARVANRPDTENTLVEIKAIDRGYPLFGRVGTNPPAAFSRLWTDDFAAPAALVEPVLLDRLGVGIGGDLRIGDAQFVIAGIITDEPDRVSGGFGLGPRVMVNEAGLAATGLVQPGSLITYRYRVALPSGDDDDRALSAFRHAADAAVPLEGWRILDRNGAAPGLRRAVEQVSLFFTLVALTALMVGGVGIANAVHGYLEARRGAIATLKALGATSRHILRIYLIQVMVIALFGIALGLAVGALVPVAAGSFIADRLPVPVAFSIRPGPLALAAAYGGLTALAFSLWPLGRAGALNAASLFRDLVAPVPRLPPRRIVTFTVLAFGVLGLLAIGAAPNRLFASGFVIGAAVAIGALCIAGVLFKGLVRWLPRFERRPLLRLALANLHRPGAPTVGVVLSLGLGLTLLVAVVLIEGNVRSQITSGLPARAPSFFFVDIQRDQAEGFDAAIAAMPGLAKLERVPSLRGQIIAFNGQRPDPTTVGPEARWALRGDRGVTYASTPPESGSVVVEGQWWPADYDGPPLVSFDEELARGFGVGLGDALTVRVMGRDITGTIANLRHIDFSSGGINYTIILSPGILETAPHTFLATAYLSADTSLEAEEQIQRAVTSRFPNVTVIAVREAIAAVNRVLGELALAVRLGGLVTVAVGVLVLAGALAAGHRRRVYDAVVLKMLGAVRARVLYAYGIEFALLGLVTALTAAGLGTLVAFLVMTRVMEASFTVLPGAIAVTLVGALVITLGLGLAGTMGALSARPAEVLRAR